MVTYAQLESEQVWHDQAVPPFMTSFLIVPLRQFYGLDANTCGAPGDNNHLYGRHRSANWDRQSRYCTNRAYGTTDARDHQGDQNWYRAVDTGIQGPTLWDVCHRLEAAVRAGQLPEVAEWFGSFDGNTVVGWYEGHPSSSDSSHLYHLHVGFWNQYADDFQVMQRVYGVITGTAPVPAPAPKGNAGMFRLIDPEGGQFVISPDTLSPTGWSYAPIENPGGVEGWALVAAGIGTANGDLRDPNHDGHADGTWRPGSFGPAKADVRAKLIDDIAAKVVASLPPGNGGGPTAAEIAKATADELHSRLAG